eukprot:6113673-Alexandrium_andersonii.AAC.1
MESLGGTRTQRGPNSKGHWASMGACSRPEATGPEQADLLEMQGRHQRPPLVALPPGSHLEATQDHIPRVLRLPEGPRTAGVPPLRCSRLHPLDGHDRHPPLHGLGGLPGGLGQCHVGGLDQGVRGEEPGPEGEVLVAAP